jgi:NADH-quinone oxidoreductase subunit L
MLHHIWIIPAITFSSFWLILFFGKKLPRHGSELGVLAVGLTLVLSVVTLGQWLDVPKEHTVAPAAAISAEHRADEATQEAGASDAGHEQTGAAAGEATAEHEAIRQPVKETARWMTLGDVKIDVGFFVDGFTVMLLFVVALISFLVHVFATSYMHDDRRYTHFFAALSLFTTGMFVLVTASNTFQALFGWELMGCCSFMLIGHWWEEQANSNAALKAFFTTRTGDVGLLVGISTLFWAAGKTFDIATINERALTGQIGHTALVLGAIALLIAVIGKSGQFPLHTWLPDAMAGPTPVSALLHAATMVVAGVYLLARLYGVFWSAFDIGGGGINPVAVVGAVTIVIAAALAFVQTDIKKVLAYSTVSQLGYMVMALGVGAWTGAVFHLFTHAFFKALLFLGAGSASHAVHSFEMKNDMGGLRKYMPKTFVTFVIGSMALSGLFPFAGFWSKDEILLGAGKNGYEFFLVVGIIGAFMTTAYMTRCVYLTFFGEYRGHGHPHESPAAITVPLIVLAVFSVGAGLLNAPFANEWFGKLVENDVFFRAAVPTHQFNYGYAAVSTVVVLAAFALMYVLYFKEKLPRGVTERNAAARAGYGFLWNKYYLDHVYTDGVVYAVKRPIAGAAYWFNQHVLDGIVNGVGIGFSRFLGPWLYKYIDQGAIDGAVNGSGLGAEGSGSLLRRIQTGRVQQYGSLLFGATALLAAALIFIVQGSN